MSWVAIVAILWGLAIVWIIYLLWKAPWGWEDSNGYHNGKRNDT